TAKMTPRITATTAPAIRASSVPVPASGEMPKSSSIQSTSSFLPRMRSLASSHFGVGERSGGDGLDDERARVHGQRRDAHAGRDVRGEDTRERVGHVLL